MLTRGWRCAFGVLVLFASCTSPAPPTTAENEPPSVTPTSPPATSATEPAIGSLPSDCGERSDLRGRHRITFVKEGRLFATSRRGNSTICLQEAQDARLLAWGPAADRFYFDNFRHHNVVSDLGARRRQRIPSDGSDPTWSRPKGTSVVYISKNGRSLLKEPAAGGPPEDISFLNNHTAVAYHPAGTHIVVSGSRADTGYGIYLATNTGSDPQLLAQGEDAERIDDLAFGRSGEWLHFTATHKSPRRRHIHSIRLTSQEGESDGTVREGRLRTLFRGRSLAAFTVSPHSTLPHLFAFTTHCDRPSTYLLDGKRRAVGNELRDRITIPVGFLPKDALLLLAFDERCHEGPGDLYILGRAGVPTLLASGVEAAAVRARYPPAPDPPGANSPEEVVA